jgi:hypothetical protein
MWAEEFDALLATIGPRCGWDVRAPEVETSTRCLLIPKSRYGFYSPLPNPSIAVDIGEDVISVIHLSSSASAVSVRRDRVRALQAQYLFKEGEKGSRFPRVALVLRIPDMSMLSIGCPVSRGLGWGRVPRKSSDRFSWRVEVLDWQEPPAYWVSAADWLTLVETFGLTPQLEDRARRWGRLLGRLTAIALPPARVSALAGANDVLVSNTLRDLVIGSGLEFEDRGTHDLKGVPGEWQLSAVTS